MIRLDRYFPLVLSLLFVLTPAMMRAADPGARLLDTEAVVHDGEPSLRLRVAVDNTPGLLVPQEAGEWRREERHVTDPVTGEEEVWVLEGPAPDLSLRSFLVAVPEGYAPPAEPRTVEGELVDPATGEPLAEFGTIEGEIRPAQVGLVRAAQVFYRLPETERAVEARFDVAFTPESGPRRTLARRAERSVASLFVNPEDAVVLLAADRRSSTPELLQPPGDIRMSFTAEHRVYRVPMASLGVDGESVDTVQLIHHGAVLPFDVAGEDIVFYAQRRVTDADTDDSVFVKLVEEGASPRLTTRPAFETLSAPEFPAEVEVVRNRRYDWNLVYEPAMVSAPVGSRFAFHRVGWGNTRVHQLPIHDLVTNTFISMKAELHGRSATPGFDPDHYANLSFGGVALPQVSWLGRTKRIATFNFTLLSVPSIPIPTLEFRHQIPNNTPVILGGGADEQYLDVVDITYLAKPRLEGGIYGRLQLTASGSPRLVTMGGFPAGTSASDILVLDTTVPSSPVRITGSIAFADESGTVAVTFEAPPTAGTYHFERLGNLAPPISITESETLPMMLPAGTTLKGIVVRDQSYSEAIEPWIFYRGTGIVEVDPQAAYNVFNGGQSSPESIQDALAHIIESAGDSVAAPFVVLLGHGSFDRKNYLGFKSVPWIPAFLDEGVVFNYNPATQSGTTIENAVDLPFALLFGEDNLADVQVTRWPVKSIQEIETIIMRSLGHDLVAESLHRVDRPAIFVADSEAAFIQDQPIWASIWGGNGFPSILMTKNQPVIDLNGLTNARAVRFGVERRDGQDNPLGAYFVAYVGHGNWDRWSNPQLASSVNTSSNPLLNADVSTFNTIGQWPIVATFTCLNGDYTAPGRVGRSLAEAWIVSPIVGAMASISPNGVDYYNEQRLLQGAYLDQLGAANVASRAVTIGEMSHRASVQYATQYPTLMKTLREYIVFGDPVALTTVVPQQAELIVTVTSSVESVKDGVPFELTVMVENVGTAEARGVDLQLPLPEGVSALDVQSEWGETTSEAGMVTLSFGSLLPGQSASGVVTVVTEPGSPNPVELTTTAVSITPPAGDPALDTASVIILRLTETMSIY